MEEEEKEEGETDACALPLPEESPAAAAADDDAAAPAAEEEEEEELGAPSSARDVCWGRGTTRTDPGAAYETRLRTATSSPAASSAATAGSRDGAASGAARDNFDDTLISAAAAAAPLLEAPAAGGRPGPLWPGETAAPEAGWGAVWPSGGAGRGAPGGVEPENQPHIQLMVVESRPIPVGP